MNKVSAKKIESDGFRLTPGYKQYALGLFLVVYAINLIDRQIFSILVEPIREDIQLSDTQLGLLGGVAFALFYTFAGIPIARWADRGVRKNIVALAMIIWSGMTMLTSMASSFLTLIIARIGVGIGEAGCSPPIHSMLSDYFPEDKRATALATYSLGVPIGGAIGTLAGGWVGEYFGWRTAFLVVGLPGIVIAAIVYLTIKEPPRGYSEPAGKATRREWVSLKDTMSFMLSLTSFRHLSIAGALHALVAYGVGLFTPSFFIRVHGFGLAETSTYLFFIGLTGMIGTYLGGYLGDRYGARDRRWYMGIPALATILSVPFAAIFYTTNSSVLALSLAVPSAILGAMFMGPVFATTQSLVTPAMRSLAAAFLMFVLNLVGLGLGPVCAGALSDFIRPTYGEESIRYSLLIIAVVGNSWSALHYWLASRTLPQDLAAKARLDVPDLRPVE